jgi:hypothetical protein
MIRSFHQVGRDAEVDKAFDALRGALDELKQMEIDEFDIPEEKNEESDSSASVQAETSGEDQAPLAVPENEDPDALQKADEIAAHQSVDRGDDPTPKV